MAILIIGGIALFGGNNNSDQPASENVSDEQRSEESTANAVVNKQEEITVTKEDTEGNTEASTVSEESTANAVVNEQEEITVTKEDTERNTEASTVSEEASSSSAINPSDLFLSLARSVDIGGTETGSEQTESDLVDDPVAIRQKMVEQFESLGISEEDLADFLAAYDTLTDESVMEKLEALTEEESLALIESLTVASEPVFEGIIKCLEPLMTAAFNNVEEPDLNALEEEYTETVRCMVDSLNEFGRQVIAVLEEHEIIET